MKKAFVLMIAFLMFLSLFKLPGSAQGAQKNGDAELAQELSNPLADLMSIPFQMNYDSNRQDISITFVQPFAAYTWPSAWTVSLQSESTYNWKTEKWSVPINAAVSKLVRWGKLPVNLQAGTGYWLESSETGPEGFRFRLQATFVLPKLF